MKHTILISGLALPILMPQGAHAQKKTNIILIVTDQQRGDALGCAGKYGILTPNIDSLASDGFFFDNAYTAAPSSTPARAGLLTGMTPWHHGLLGYSNKIGEHYTFEMPQMLRDNGYLTLGIGKMHWTPQNALHGFHATIIDESGRVESPYFCSDYRKWFQTMAPGVNPDSTGIGWNSHAAAAYKLDERLHPTAWTGETAVSTIRHYDPQSGRPLFLKVSFARPHSPYDPPQRVLDLYNDTEIPAAAHAEWSDAIGAKVTDPAKEPNAAFGQFSDEYVANTRRHYFAAITFIDEQVGEIVKALKEKGMYDNTLIVFTSDHGDMMGDHNHWRKTYPYEGSAAIPMVMKVPASLQTLAEKGSVIHQPVELRDILPTFLVAAGDTVPAEMDGMPMYRLLTDKNPEWRRWIDLEHSTCYNADGDWCALTDGKMKYIWFQRTGTEQLFDLTADPDETRNVIKDRKYAATASEMRQALARHLAERGESWVDADGNLVVRAKTQLYSPNFPRN